MSANPEDVSPGAELAGTLISTAEGRNSALFLAVVPGAQSSARHIGHPPIRACGTNAWHPLCTELCLLSAPASLGHPLSSSLLRERAVFLSLAFLPFLCHIANMSDKEIGGEGINPALRKEV